MLGSLIHMKAKAKPVDALERYKEVVKGLSDYDVMAAVIKLRHNRHSLAQKKRFIAIDEADSRGLLK